MASIAACHNCQGKALYGRVLSSAGGQGPQLLKGLGSFMHFPNFEVVVCAACGFTHFFAEDAAREQLASHPDWQAITTQ